jgi:hypothetical protein
MKDIFLSHRSTDKEFVRRLSQDIEKAVFQDRNLETWVDEAEIKPGQSITGAVNDGLEQSRFVALILTPEYFKSPSGWTDAEWHAALFADPDNKKGKIIPILAADCPKIPVLLRHLKMIDLRVKKYDEGVRELVSYLKDIPQPKPLTQRGQIISNGNISRETLTAELSIPQAQPDVVTENLYCNLLPVLELPKFVYVGQIKSSLRKKVKNKEVIPSKKELIKHLHEIQKENGMEKVFTPAFRCFEDKIITFHNLDSIDSVFNPLLEEDSVAQILTKELIKDEDERNLVTSLLNMSLSRHLYKCNLIIDDSKNGRFFFPMKEGGEHVITWKPFKKNTPRTVVKPYKKGDDVLCWLHQGAYLKMLFLSNNYYIQILPTWVITEEGTKVKGGSKVAAIVNRWTSGERNLALIYHVRFWTFVLKGGYVNINIRTGDQNMQVGIKPAFIQVAFGIKADYKNLLKILDQEAFQIAELENQIADIAIDESIEEDDDEFENDFEEMLNEEIDNNENQAGI